MTCSADFCFISRYYLLSFSAALFFFVCTPYISAEDSPKKQPETPANSAEQKNEKQDGKQSEKQNPADKSGAAAKPEVKPETKPDAKPTQTAAPAQTAKPEAKPEVKPEAKPEVKPDVVELKKEPLRVTAKGTGTFEPRQSESILLKSEEFTTFEILEIVPHGKKIKQGEVLVKFDPKKYEEQYNKKKRAGLLSEIALKQSEIEYKYLEKKQPVKSEVLEREKKYADEDFLFFLNVEQDWAKRMTDYRLGQAQYYVDNAKEELKQLEKMYKADDLVEDTEEFILKRSKYILSSQEFFYELNKMRTDRTKDVLIPREDFEERHNSKVRQLNYEQAKETFGFALQQARIKLEESQETHAKLAESFEKFVKDKELLTIKSPGEGIVYYGEYNSKFSPGTWSNASTLAGLLKPGNSVSNNTVLFTIVNPKPALVRTTVLEKDIHWITVGTRGAIRPTAFPNTRYEVAVVECNEIPSAGNTFSALLAVELPDDAKIYPNMTGALDLIVYDKKEAILVPASALKKEETEDDTWNHSYLYVQGDNKTVNKVKVKTGIVKGDKVEVLDGVFAGQKVFKKFDDGEKPQPEKK